MTELSNLTVNSALSGSSFEALPAKPNMWKRPLAALLLGLLALGLGQLYNRQPWKAIVIALLAPAMYVPFGYLGAFHRFGYFVCLVGFQLILLLCTVIAAFRTARRHSRQGVPAWEFPVVWRVAAFLIVIAPPTLASEGVLLDRVLRIRAYKIPSVSNCPTICPGERMIADPSAFAGKTPDRGALITFQHEEGKALWVKRVIGLPGDEISDSNGDVLVNGKRAAAVDFSKVCGSPPLGADQRTPVHFQAVKVPENSLFVVGDNSGNSFDSRFEEFGFVKISQVRGRPLFIYWSPYPRRVGCPIH